MLNWANLFFLKKKQYPKGHRWQILGALGMMVYFIFSFLLRLKRGLSAPQRANQTKLSTINDIALENTTWSLTIF